MKYLLLLAVLVVAYLLWRSGRTSRGAAGASRPGGKPQDMVRCATCGVHLPRSEAVSGSNGLQYCSQEHRLGAGS